MMKNPYYINFTWLSLVVVLSGLILLCSCDCDCCLFNIANKWENIIIGIFSSGILLLLSETIQYFHDKLKHSYLEGTYYRSIITEILPNNKREEELTDEERKKISEHKRIIPGSRYAELKYYADFGKDFKIVLKYLYNGIYTGTAEYHNYIENNSRSTNVNFTFVLNKANLKTGSGSYQYANQDDFGTYTFQVNETNQKEIVVYYKNTIPSGLAEGYERWYKK